MANASLVPHKEDTLSYCGSVSKKEELPTCPTTKRTHQIRGPWGEDGSRPAFIAKEPGLTFLPGDIFIRRLKPCHQWQDNGAQSGFEVVFKQDREVKTKHFPFILHDHLHMAPGYPVQMASGDNSPFTTGAAGQEPRHQRDLSLHSPLCRIPIEDILRRQGGKHQLRSSPAI
ncbi:hypothetical protein BSL78_02359 [Apostichopus japonicus]|uniref:Uncharacterized protein n=1 Tax=Stichopus japonicus TaxID=307972 RepID=A0A2G8LK81_STIJA|nr:hypothetical protein BSL78_02359 [Apostichopus japonicus]